MVRPLAPDGSSTWHHTADRHELLGDEGAPWAALTTSGDDLSLAFPFVGERYDTFTVFAVAVGPSGVTWHDRHAGFPAPRERLWTPETPAADLWRTADVRALRKFRDHDDRAPRLAVLSVARGVVRVDDALGRARIVLALGRVPEAKEADGSDAAVTGVLRGGAATAVGYALFAPAGTRVVTSASSLP